MDFGSQSASSDSPGQDSQGQGLLQDLQADGKDDKLKELMASLGLTGLQVPEGVELGGYSVEEWVEWTVNSLREGKVIDLVSEGNQEDDLVPSHAMNCVSP